MPSEKAPPIPESHRQHVPPVFGPFAPQKPPVFSRIVPFLIIYGLPLAIIATVTDTGDHVEIVGATFRALAILAALRFHRMLRDTIT